MAQLNLQPSARDHVQGGKIGSPYTLIEYGDYECPHCAQAQTIVKALQEELGEDMCLIFRNFPLREAHPHAEHAAEAAEIAGEHGKFWEMHDLLFENQESLADSDLIGYACQIGLDSEVFRERLSSECYAPRVQEDFMSGVKSGVNGTPNFFVNGQLYDNQLSVEALSQALRSVG